MRAIGLFREILVVAAWPDIAIGVGMNPAGARGRPLGLPLRPLENRPGFGLALERGFWLTMLSPQDAALDCCPDDTTGKTPSAIQK
jgi:hypothetical protein